MTKFYESLFHVAKRLASILCGIFMTISVTVYIFTDPSTLSHTNAFQDAVINLVILIGINFTTVIKNLENANKVEDDNGENDENDLTIS